MKINKVPNYNPNKIKTKEVLKIPIASIRTGKYRIKRKDS